MGMGLPPGPPATQPTKYVGVLADSETELGLLELKIDSYEGTRDILSYYIASTPDAQLLQRGLIAPVINITGIFDAAKEDRNDSERRLRRLLTTTADVYCVNLSKGTAFCFVPQRPSHAINVPFWDSIDNYGLTGLQRGQTLGYAKLAAECTTDDGGIITTDYFFLEGIERNALRLKVMDIGVSAGSKSVYFKLDQTAHGLPLGNYEFIMRARASAVSDTLTMTVSNEDVTEDWEEAHDSAAATAFLCLKKHLGKLYAGGDNGIIYVSEDGTTWTTEYDTTQSEVHCLETHESRLYAGTGNNGKIFMRDYNGVWAEDYDLANAETDVNALKSCWGYLFAGGNSRYFYRKAASAWAEWHAINIAKCSCIYDITERAGYMSLAVADGSTPTTKAQCITFYTASLLPPSYPPTYNSIWAVAGDGTDMLTVEAVGDAIYLGDGGGATPGRVYKATNPAGYDIKLVSGQSAVNGIFNFYGSPFIATSAAGKLYRYNIDDTLTEVGDFWDFQSSPPTPDHTPHLYCGENFRAHNYIGTGDTGKIYRTTDAIKVTKDIDCNSDHTYKWFALPFTIKEGDEGDTIRFKVTNNYVTLKSSAHVYIDVMGIVSK